MHATPDRDQAIGFLLSRIDYEKAQSIPYGEWEFRLDRMRNLLARLGNPHQRLQIVHVAGTKGKGSTSAMIAAVLSAAGYRTGLYTSPHLDRLEERLMVDSRPCSEAELVALVEQIRPIVEQMDVEAILDNSTPAAPTYFEVTTAMAMLHFAQVGVDAAVLEVGLGGRLDSTNVCQPLVSVITSISFDHTKQLGNTLAKIAGEKAGIIKPGVPVVSGVVDEEPRCVIAQIARDRGSRLVQGGVEFTFEYRLPREVDCKANRSNCGIFGTMDFHHRVTGTMLHHIELGLLGRHQAANAAVAMAALEELRLLGWRMPEKCVRQGLRNLHWPARVEVVSRNPTIVVDGAHNTASIRSLLETIEESFVSSRRILVFATTQEKVVRGMLQLLLPKFETVIFTEYLNNPRVMSVAEMESIAAEFSTEERLICTNPASAWAKVRELATPEHLVCITGSFFLAAEMRQEILRNPLQQTAIEPNFVRATEATAVPHV